MLSFAGSLKVFVAVEACDLRKGFNGLERAHVPDKIRTLKKGKDLAKQTSGANHCGSPLMWGLRFQFPPSFSSKTEILFTPFQNLFWTRVL